MIERTLESIMFGSRWLLAPMFLGLIGCLAFLMLKFGQEFLHLLMHVHSISERELILGVLSLVDLTLVANLLVMVVFSGYENFVSKIDVAGHEDRPEWMGKVDYSGLKLKLIGSIVAISAIELLRAFMNMNLSEPNHGQLAWMVGIHVTFIVSGVLFAVMDNLAERTKHA